MEKSISSKSDHDVGKSDRSRLLELPIDVMRDIISHLHYSADPALAMLRRTHTSFFHIIPRTDIRSKATESDLRGQLLTIERSFNTLLPPNHLACFQCLRMLPSARFGDSERCNGKGIGCIRAHKRFCVDCGFTKQIYARGALVLIDGKLTSLCHKCRQPVVPFEKSFDMACPLHTHNQLEAENTLVYQKAGRLKMGDRAGEAVDLLRWWFPRWGHRRMLPNEVDLSDDLHKALLLQ